MHLIDNPLSGPVNLVGPTAATAAEVVREIARRERRPYWLPAPAFAISAALGDAGRDLLLADQNVRPLRLEESGFAFAHRDLPSAVAALD